MRASWLGLLFMLSGSAIAFAPGHAHIHGKGTIHIAQDDALWQLQFTLPAADVFGFEHAPENQRQIHHVKTQIESIEKAQSLLMYPKGCVLSSKDYELPFDKGLLAHQHNEEHGHEDKHSEETHQDVEVTVTLACSVSFNQISVNVFESFPSIKGLEAIWAVSHSQGSAQVSAASSMITFL